MSNTATLAGNTTAEANQFSEIFRTEHRETRDLILELVEAYQNRNTSRIPQLLSEIAAGTGPHFRYEEESMYPALVQFFGAEYVRKLFQDHDGIIATARKLVALAEENAQTRNVLTQDEVESAISGARSMLPHVTDCDGLSLLVERLPVEAVRKILDTRDKARSEGLDLLTWAATVRGRSQNRPN